MNSTRAATIRRALRARGRVLDAGLTLTVGIIVAIMIHTSDEEYSRPPDARAYAIGVAMTLPLFLHRVRPIMALVLASAGLFVYYELDYPGIPPTAALALPFYSTVYAGHARWAVAVCVGFFSVGYVMVIREASDPLATMAAFLTHAAFAVTVMLLAEVVRNRRALAAETRERLRLAAEERELEAARRVAEDRVRIARELHDTVAHSMATIAVQAGSALHILDDRDEGARPALAAIRETSKQALKEMRATLGVLRSGADAGDRGPAGLDRLDALLEAVRAAGVPVDLQVTGTATALAPPADHAAYRILQESLTNVLRHAEPDVRVRVWMAYTGDGLDLEIVNNGGPGPGEHGQGQGHGLNGMRERALAIGGAFSAGPGPSGGFRVTARLPANPSPGNGPSGGGPSGRRADVPEGAS
ncbi:sensor histidine kinase [Actinomadura rubrisoli]|uniref:histidine kinase n=1 Tax=Actinomadura rubrisoli TaxID=2530368 RepID=A0A4R5A6A6_9ACTN|nr:sensor histidine kinase [Actinomadura rubrisoli]TDD66174.1 sensor histidine kinase [Actinomadura rubrisoli]